MTVCLSVCTLPARVPGDERWTTSEPLCANGEMIQNDHPQNCFSGGGKDCDSGEKTSRCVPACDGLGVGRLFKQISVRH